MSDVTQILESVAAGKSQAADELLPLVYNELRRLAAARLANERPGQTLQPTALVHEAYLRLLDGETRPQQWQGRRHFFSAAAEAMRRILVDAARSKNCLKRGEMPQKVEVDIHMPDIELPPDDVLDVHEALDLLAKVDADAAELVNLHYFAGFTLAESASIMNVTERTVGRYWAFARTWLSRRLASRNQSTPPIR